MAGLRSTLVLTCVVMTGSTQAQALMFADAKSSAPVEPLLESDPRISRDGPLWRLAGRPMTGTLKRLDQAGVATLTPLQRGRVHGLVISRFANGQRRGEGAFVHGQAQGVHRAWWPSGQLQSEQSFKADKPDGALRTWYASGRPYQEHHYVQGQEEGPQRVWFEDQRLRANYVVRDGRRYGSIGAMTCDGGQPNRARKVALAAQSTTAAVVEWIGAATP
jgi:hypothetical protein